MCEGECACVYVNVCVSMSVSVYVSEVSMYVCECVVCRV